MPSRLPYCGSSSSSVADTRCVAVFESFGQSLDGGHDAHEFEDGVRRNWSRAALAPHPILSGALGLRLVVAQPSVRTMSSVERLPDRPLSVEISEPAPETAMEFRSDSRRPSSSSGPKTRAPAGRTRRLTSAARLSRSWRGTPFHSSGSAAAPSSSATRSVTVTVCSSSSSSESAAIMCSSMSTGVSGAVLCRWWNGRCDELPRRRRVGRTRALGAAAELAPDGGTTAPGTPSPYPRGSVATPPLRAAVQRLAARRGELGQEALGMNDAIWTRAGNAQAVPASSVAEIAEGARGLGEALWFGVAPRFAHPEPALRWTCQLLLLQRRFASRRGPPIVVQFDDAAETRLVDYGDGDARVVRPAARRGLCGLGRLAAAVAPPPAPPPPAGRGCSRAPATGRATRSTSPKTPTRRRVRRARRPLLDPDACTLVPLVKSPEDMMANVLAPRAWHATLVLDLGCGDGRVVLAAARARARAASARIRASSRSAARARAPARRRAQHARASPCATASSATISRGRERHPVPAAGRACRNGRWPAGAWRRAARRYCHFDHREARQGTLRLPPPLRARRRQPAGCSAPRRSRWVHAGRAP